MNRASEMDTVVKRVLPYLKRREYDQEKDFDFETPMRLATRYAMGYADILVTCGKASPQFLIEAKRDSRKLTPKDRDQAIEYGETLKTAFVVVTNGKEVRCYNTRNKKAILWNGKLGDKIPSKSQLPKVLASLRTNPLSTDIALGDSLTPFRPALPLKQLNGLFKRCHNTIRKIEKNEESAFADFSKLLFLKLLEEKSDIGLFNLPYSYRYYELADKPDSEADQVKVAVENMIEQIRGDYGYGDVLGDRLRLNAPKTYQYIVRQLAGVYFSDSNLDSKGAAFEYFVRATLKGKKLGQYFTPRPLIETMVYLCGKEKIVNALRAGEQPRVLDPACGTGGFLVYLMNLCLTTIEELAAANKINNSTKIKLVKAVKETTFFGSDANPGVACSAKMNMVVAGDGHTNILPEDSLTLKACNWSSTESNCDFILTNPPFGTSESESLTKEDRRAYPVASTKGQHLFLQKMVQATKPGGEICTVIDEGVLNVETAKDLRRWILQNCKLLAVLRLPEETFKPNKINVRSSVLYLRRNEIEDIDLENEYPITFCDIHSLGYVGSGDPIRNFDTKKFLADVEKRMRDHAVGPSREGYCWRAFDVSSRQIAQDTTWRIDLKYWEPDIRSKIQELIKRGGKSIGELNLIKTLRGKSPDADLYVDEPDGFAAVIKAGSSINKFGEIELEGDYIEKSVYEDMPGSAMVQKGDVLLASTGDGTLGKCGTYDLEKPAVADGHVTIIRANKKAIAPHYLTDYLRHGFGALQISRLYTGSTGLIELAPDQVDQIIIDVLDGDVKAQRAASAALRSAEQRYRKDLDRAKESFNLAVVGFGAGHTIN